MSDITSTIDNVKEQSDLSKAILSDSYGDQLIKLHRLAKMIRDTALIEETKQRVIDFLKNSLLYNKDLEKSQLKKLTEKFMLIAKHIDCLDDAIKLLDMRKEILMRDKNKQYSFDKEEKYSTSIIGSNVSLFKKPAEKQKTLLQQFNLEAQPESFDIPEDEKARSLDSTRGPNP